MEEGTSQRLVRGEVFRCYSTSLERASQGLSTFHRAVAWEAPHDVRSEEDTKRRSANHA